jgi:hypothetical protein
LISPVTGNLSLNIGLPEGNTPHALAWTWMQAGAHEEAGALLRPADERFRRSQAEGRLRHFSEGLAYFARNTLLLGDVESALELLDQAVEAGWREYYMKIRDPRWALVDDEPRFKSIMARVKADIDQQRARMEQVDAEDNFTARLAACLGTGGSRWRGAEQQSDDERRGEKKISRRSGERGQVLHRSSFRLRDKALLANVLEMTQERILLSRALPENAGRPKSV